MVTARDLNWSHHRLQQDTFRELFPQGMAVTQENALTASKAGMPIRWLAEQTLELDPLTDFCERAAKLLSLYLENIAETWEAIRELNPYGQKMKWLDADEVHNKNKHRHWDAYRHGLAKAFVDCMEKQRAIQNPTQA